MEFLPISSHVPDPGFPRVSSSFLRSLQGRDAMPSIAHGFAPSCEHFHSHPSQSASARRMGHPLRQSCQRGQKPGPSLGHPPGEFVGHFRRYAERASVGLHHRASQLHHRRRSQRSLTRLLEFLYFAQFSPRRRGEDVHVIITRRILPHKLLCVFIVPLDVFRPFQDCCRIFPDREVIHG
jgi:hypothetical protein